MSDAQATGGNYSAFLPHKHGKLQITFQFPLAVCAKKRKRKTPVAPKKSQRGRPRKKK